MDSELGMLIKHMKRFKIMNDYDPDPRSWSSYDHVSLSIIYSLASMIAGLLWAPLYWLYLATWLWHCVAKEIVHDTFIKKKNGSPINWRKVWAQVVERSLGHVICLPILIGLLILK